MDIRHVFQATNIGWGKDLFGMTLIIIQKKRLSQNLSLMK